MERCMKISAILQKEYTSEEYECRVSLFGTISLHLSSSM
jgi:hypothetical protein